MNNKFQALTILIIIAGAFMLWGALVYSFIEQVLELVREFNQ